jgi:hypothetical protein
MRRIALLTSVALAVIVWGGCKQSTVEGPSGKKLTLTKPADQTLKRGEPNQVKVSINRDNFRDAVTITFEDLPAGVQVQDKEKKIAPEENSATFTMQADAKAEMVTNHNVKVIATGPDGMKVTEVFKISVKDK